MQYHVTINSSVDKLFEREYCGIFKHNSMRVIDNQSVISSNFVFTKRCVINAHFVPPANERNNRHYTYQ